VPKLKLNEINLPSSKSKSISKKDKAHSSTTTTYNTMADPRSQALSPNSNGLATKMVGAGSSRNTPDSAASGASRKTSSTNSGVSFAPQRTNSGGADGRKSSTVQNNNHRVDYEQPMMTPRGGSYRDILVTPRGTTRSLAEQHIPNNTRSTSRPSSATTGATQEQQQRAWKQKVDRASQEQTHVKQQISTLDAAIQAQQAALVDNIATIQNLGTRRGRLANDAAALQAAVARAQAAASARHAEIQELEVLISSLQATLQVSQREEEEQQRGDTAGTTSVVSTKKQVLIKLMQAAAGTLRFPSVALALETELQKQQQTQHNTNRNEQQQQSARAVLAGRGITATTGTGTGTSRAVTARSDMSTSRFLTPAGTGREGGEEDINDSDSIVSSSSGGSEGEDDSLDSSRTGIAEDDVPLAASTTNLLTTTTSTAAAGKVHRPGMNNVHVPLLQLPQLDTIPAHFNINNNSNNNSNVVTSEASARLKSPNAQALARLQSIRSKLEVAEAILTARVPENGEETTV
jgi:hypothetical protein